MKKNLFVILLCAAVALAGCTADGGKYMGNGIPTGKLTSLCVSQSAMSRSDCYSFAVRRGESGELRFSAWWLADIGCDCALENIPADESLADELTQIMRDGAMLARGAKPLFKSPFVVLDETTYGFSAEFDVKGEKTDIGDQRRRSAKFYDGLSKIRSRLIQVADERFDALCGDVSGQYAAADGAGFELAVDSGLRFSQGGPVGEVYCIEYSPDEAFSFKVAFGPVDGENRFGEYYMYFDDGGTVELAAQEDGERIAYARVG